MSEFHAALGQYLNYLQAFYKRWKTGNLSVSCILLYLSKHIATFFKMPFIQKSLQRYAVNIIVYDPVAEVSDLIELLPVSLAHVLDIDELP